MSHHQDANFLKKHIKTGTTEDGACLTRHQGRKENDSCSHIWQAFKKAESDSGVYNDKCGSLVGTTHKSGARQTRRGAIFPAGLAVDAAGPANKSAWNLGVGQNFQNWTVPYWHNAHHIIPNGVLASAIADAAGDDSSVGLLIRSGLLSAKYNLNHMVNMIILPMGEEVARALGLPRHLIGRQAKPGESPEYRSHVNYSDKVKTKLNGVMDDYLQALGQRQPGHPAPPNDLSRDKLNKASESVYGQIKDFGTGSPGAPISRMNVN